MIKSLKFSVVIGDRRISRFVSDPKGITDDEARSMIRDMRNITSHVGDREFSFNVV